MTGPLPGPLSYASRSTPPYVRAYVRTREHDSRCPRRNCAPLTVYFGVRVGAGSDPPFLVEKLPRKGVLVTLFPSVPGVAPSPRLRRD